MRDFGFFAKKKTQMIGQPTLAPIRHACDQSNISVSMKSEPSYKRLDGETARQIAQLLSEPGPRRAEPAPRRHPPCLPPSIVSSMPHSLGRIPDGRPAHQLAAAALQLSTPTPQCAGAYIYHPYRARPLVS